MPTFEQLDANNMVDPSWYSSIWAQNPTATPGQTSFAGVDMNTGQLLNTSSSTPSLNTTVTSSPSFTGGQATNLANTGSTTLPSLSNTANNNLSTSYNYTPTVPTQPTAPVSPVSPTYNNTLGDMYTRTFTDPNSMWNEYNQGQGVNFTQGAARAMAKAGRTGMLPTLTSLAHQDYMSNYLPSVRKDLAPGLGYENTWNQNLTQKYGQDQDFLQKGFGTEASMYGQGLTYASNMAQVAAQVTDIGVKQELGMLDAAMKNLDIDETTKRQIYASMTELFPKMTAADQAAMVADLKLALGINEAGKQTLADLINPVGSTQPTTTTTTAPTYADFGTQW